MQTAIQLSVTTLQIGAVYILFSLGLTLIFGVMKIVNFAHGHVFALSAMMVAVLVPVLDAAGFPLLLGYLLAALSGIAASLALGFVIYQGGFRFFQRDLIGSFILAIGLVLFLDGLYLELFGGAVRPVPEIFDGRVNLFGAAITTQRLALCVAAIAFTGGLYWVLTMTKLGQALRAVSIDHEAAMLQGIPYDRIAFAGFMIATGLGALAGVLIAPISVVTPVIGADYLIKGFIAVIVGGLGSVPGAIVGGLFIALIETVGGYYYDPSTATVATFALVIVVLLVRPQGLLGRG
ncbi:branched-chain amino acid ABC transporter permease [Acuticoccus sp.]|uniref:branched-chain amino acid ABC transporter permease n=1 Tax=Acuticoccus sp. TaxID=1904378 RepID=UPI003B52FC9F